MEDRFVTAIAHKDNIMRYRLSPNSRTIDLLKAWHHEIFKFAKVDDALELYVEAKYEAEIDYLLSQHGITALAKEGGLGFVILVGLGLAADPAYLARVMDLTADMQVERIAHSERSLELMLPTQNVARAVALLHQELIGENS
ncbi:MAG: hypothetical protein LRZ88_05380 [Candidatus Cloacimonetes bacterium]|nr:hypothetical protein [Candidatus Cloacimonadota bacterium]